MNATTASPRFYNSRLAVFLLVALLASLRLCHVHLLWADEDYHLAAALNILHGKIPYRDFWYDKPPLNALYYLLIRGHSGWLLRLLDAAYVLLASFLAFLIARAWWGEIEGRLAAILLAFFLAFYLPSATIPFAVDALMIVPHLAAVYYALTRQSFWAGASCAFAFLINPKAIFVIAVCGLWLFGAWLPFCLGLFLPLLTAALLSIACGAWSGYCEQIWRWGWIYATQSPTLHPLLTGVVRSIDWLGFHVTLAAGTIVALVLGSRSDRWKLGSWLTLSFLAVCSGTRFEPRYFLQLLPACVIASSHGVLLAWRHSRRWTAALLALMLLVPLARFGPRYASLAYDNFQGRPPRWSDVALDLDAQQAAQQIRQNVHPGDTLFVWGYRPDMYVYTRLISDGKFWDSQPLTGVPADRHLHAITTIYSGPAAANRLQFIKTNPTWFVDGLGLLNPALKPDAYPEIRNWMKQYRIVGRTKLCVIYRLIAIR
jgi:hypothetical protein